MLPSSAALQRRYLENVPTIVPVLEKEYRNASKRLEETQVELNDLHPEKLKVGWAVQQGGCQRQGRWRSRGGFGGAKTGQGACWNSWRPAPNSEHLLPSSLLNPSCCLLALQEKGRIFREAFLSKLALLLRGTVAAPPERFGETLADEHIRGGAFVGPDNKPVVVHEHLPNAHMRLFGGAQYHRAMAEFRAGGRTSGAGQAVGS